MDINKQLLLMISKIVERDIELFEVSFTAKILTNRMDYTNCLTYDDYLEYLLKTAQEQVILKTEFEVVASEFFRELYSLSILEHSILPSLVNSNIKKQTIRIWSVGCAAGQEPFSIAMIMLELQQRLGSLINYHIFATDISSNALDLAKKATYESCSVKNVRYGLLNKYFQIVDKGYQLLPTVYNSVNFSQFDIMNEAFRYPPDSIYGDFDLIVCCNLLIYYKPEVQKQIIKKLISSIRNRGYLMVGDTERLLYDDIPEIKRVNYSHALYQIRRRSNI